MMPKLLRTLSIQISLVALCLLAAPPSATAQNNSAAKFLPAIMLLLGEKKCEKNDDGADFNGDGCADLAIGAPRADVGSRVRAGQVNIMYGNVGGVSSHGNQTWHLGGGYDSNGTQMGDIQGATHNNDLFGSVIATGDFNNDGYSDLAVGVQQKDIGLDNNAGAVYVIYGSSTGLSAVNNQQLNQDGISTDPEGDGNGPRLGDLNFASPESEDHFGGALATGDFNNDNFDDLAIGVPGEDIGSIENAGALHIIYGSINGLKSDNNEFWHQNQVLKHVPPNNNAFSPGDIRGGAEAFDFFGQTLASGDFNGDNFDDLAVGIPGEDIGNIVDAGAFTLLHGSISGPQAKDNHFWSAEQAIIDLDGDGGNDINLGDPYIVSETRDRLGFTLATGDINNDGYDDLVAGLPGEDNANSTDDGIVSVWYGTSNSLEVDNEEILMIIQLLQQNETVASSLPNNGRNVNDRFGEIISIGDLNGDGYDDIAFGTPQDNDGTAEYGSVLVVYGSDTRLTPEGAQFFSPTGSFTAAGSLGDFIGDQVLESEFGAALSILDLDGDGYSELVIGTPKYQISPSTDEDGSIHVLPGSVSGAQIPKHQFWTLDGGLTGNPLSPIPIGDLWGTADNQRFGAALK